MMYSNPDSVADSKRRLFDLALAKRGCLFVIALASLIKTIVIIVQMYALALCVRAVFLGRMGIKDIAFWLMVLSGSVFLRAMTHWVTARAGDELSSGVCTALRERLLEKMFVIGPVRLRQERSGDLIAAHTSGVDKLDGFYAGMVVAAVQMAVVPLFIVLAVLFVDWPTGLLFLATGPLIPLLMALTGSSAGAKMRGQWRSLRRMSAHFLDTVQGLETLKIFGREKSAAHQIRKISKLFRVNTMRVLQVAFLSGMVLELAASLSTAVIAVEVGVRLIKGWMTFERGLFLLLLAPEFYMPFRDFGAQHHAGMESAEAAVQVFHVLDGPEDIVDEKSAKMFSGTPRRLQAMNLSFSYDNRPVLENINIQVWPGRITAIVGASGSGKTTLLNLFAGFLPDKEGAILISHSPSQTIAPGACRESIAYATQFPHLFSGTIEENIAMGLKGARREDIVKAARLALADDFIERFPQGYETRLDEGGMNLSGGQRQRIALARAFIKGAPVLLLDEPANALDEELENKLMRSLRDLLTGKIILMAAHRPQSIRQADHIYVLDRGRVVESGTPGELLRPESFLTFLLKELV